jgi:hypothetical protein
MHSQFEQSPSVSRPSSVVVSAVEVSSPTKVVEVAPVVERSSWSTTPLASSVQPASERQVRERTVMSMRFDICGYSVNRGIAGELGDKQGGGPTGSSST